MPILYSDRLPRYRKHKASGQAIVTLNGQDHYLGPHGTQASKREYDRLTAQWLAGGRRLPAADNDTTIVEMLATFRRFAVTHYRKNGKPTRSMGNIDDAIRPLKMLYGRERVCDFGPLKLQTVQALMVKGYNDSQGRAVAGLSRKTINKRVGILKQIFRWAVAQEIAPPSLAHALDAVAGLQQGRTEAPEGKPVRPVSPELVEATVSFMPPVVAAMVRFQQFTGCRPGEVCILRPCDIDRTSEVWTYRPESHKTEHHGRERVIFVGPKGQDVLRTYLLRASDAYCFQPDESEQKRRAARHAERQTPLSCGNRPGTHRVRRPKRRPGEQYDSNTYAKAVSRACDLADRAAHKADPSTPKKQRLVERWSPNRLRHTLATRVRKEFGLESAQIMLGHSKADVTQIYAERDERLGVEVARQIG